MAHVPDARVRDPEYGVGVGIKGARRGEKKPKHCHYGRLRDGSFTSSFPICIKVVICRSGSSASELQMEMAAINSRHGLSTSTWMQVFGRIGVNVVFERRANSICLFGVGTRKWVEKEFKRRTYLDCLLGAVFSLVRGHADSILVGTLQKRKDV